MEKVLLGAYAREEPPVHEPACPGAGVVREEGRQETPTEHQGRSLTFKLYLPQQTRDLHAVHLRKAREGICLNLTNTSNLVKLNFRPHMG